LRDVAPRTRDAQVDDLLPGLSVPDHYHPCALAVAAARREPGVVEDAFEHLVGQWVVGESADSTRCAHDVV
jgi:hypothetical protein